MVYFPSAMRDFQGQRDLILAGTGMRCMADAILMALAYQDVSKADDKIDAGEFVITILEESAIARCYLIMGFPTERAETSAGAADAKPNDDSSLNVSDVLSYVRQIGVTNKHRVVDEFSFLLAAIQLRPHETEMALRPSVEAHRRRKEQSPWATELKAALDRLRAKNPRLAGRLEEHQEERRHDTQYAITQIVRYSTEYLKSKFFPFGDQQWAQYCQEYVDGRKLTRQDIIAQGPAKRAFRCHRAARRFGAQDVGSWEPDAF